MRRLAPASFLLQFATAGTAGKLQNKTPHPERLRRWGVAQGAAAPPLRGKACKAPLPALACGSFQLHINQRQRKEGAWLPSID